MLEDLLKELVKIPSETGNETELALFCEDYLQNIGFQVQRQIIAPRRFNILAEKGKTSKALLFYAHLDTVPASSSWTSSPYELRQDGDKLYGLGTSDMLAGLAVILKTAEQLEPQSYGLKIALTVDEEAWSKGGWHLVQSDFCKNVIGVLVPELSVDSQTEVLGIGRLGHLGLVIHCFGRKQHLALKSKELSAIERAAQIVLALKDFPLLKNKTINEHLEIKTIHAEACGLTRPELCQLELSYFFLPEHSIKSIMSELESFLSSFQPYYELSLAQRPTPIPLAYNIEQNHPFVDWVQRCFEKELGEKLTPVFGHSVADENILANQLKVPVLSLAPVGGCSHQANEWVSKRSMNKLVRVYKRLFNTLDELYSQGSNLP